ncbi:MAG: hypothetical protein H8E60_05520 [Candidatus Marinimicrobia bacterium]|nr:hypothetical protein [Candidatus Neomarinimicrobiota bacterium]
MKKAYSYIKKLNEPERITRISIDSSNWDSLAEVFTNVSMVVSTVSTAQFTENLHLVYKS